MILTQIGTVRNAVSPVADCGWGSIESFVEIRQDLRAGLLGLQEFSHAMVVTWLHLSPWDPAVHLLRHPRDREDLPLTGLFAHRARHRPNPIGVTTVEILSVESDGVRVRGLDAIDGTPILDLKPHVPRIDCAPNSRIPAWMDEVTKALF